MFKSCGYDNLYQLLFTVKYSSGRCSLTTIYQLNPASPLFGAGVNLTLVHDMDKHIE